MPAFQLASPASLPDDVMRVSCRQWNRFLSEFIRLSLTTRHVTTGP
jgi:hypothetical protein